MIAPVADGMRWRVDARDKLGVVKGELKNERGARGEEDEADGWEAEEGRLLKS